MQYLNRFNENSSFNLKSYIEDLLINIKDETKVNVYGDSLNEKITVQVFLKK
jgi:hypothetical protein